jgi:hypothetical protein
MAVLQQQTILTTLYKRGVMCTTICIKHAQSNSHDTTNSGCTPLYWLAERRPTIGQAMHHNHHIVACNKAGTLEPWPCECRVLAYYSQDQDQAAVSMPRQTMGAQCPLARRAHAPSAL